MAGKKNDDFFVNIENPVPLRKGVLESSRGVIRLLKDFEGVKLIRKEKSDLIKNLDDVMKEISTLVGKLKSELPKIPGIKAKPIKPIKVTKAKKISTPKEEVKEVSHLDKLEAELNDVEKQLADLQ